MDVTLYKGYPDYVGKRYNWAGSGYGPSSYSRTTGDVINTGQFQGQIDAVFVGQSVSGTYYAVPRPDSAGPRAAWSLHWFVVSTGVEVANAIDLSAEILVVAGFGGRY